MQCVSKQQNGKKNSHEDENIYIFDDDRDI